ncbi:SAG family member [Eimeria brunetti]|uniref:SAG family member n=1 Tax=Eimeria brunetti TaxID=51314 RepID=U6L662_9EIME|nr:SAG family member [Eimeria brunetti]
MASLFRTAAAVCLVALNGLQSQATTTITYKFTPVAVDDAAYLAANLVRNGQLPVHINEVTKGNSLVSALEQEVKSKTNEKQEAEATDPTCSELVKPEGLKDIFHYTFAYQEKPNYRELLQEALNAGLTVFKNAEYQNQWDTIWGVDAGGSLAYLLGANSTTIGCIIGECTTLKSGGGDRQIQTESKTGKAVLFCELDPETEKNKAPFDDEYFKGLIARTALLADMTEEDLKAPTNGSTAVAAVPTILAAGLVVTLTAVFA